MIEVLVAITILAVVFLGLVAIYPFGLSVTGSAKKETVASFLAQRELEELRNKGYEDIGEGVIESKHRLSTEESDYRYDYKRRTEVDYLDTDLTATSTDTGLKRISTTVYYLNDISKKEEEYTLNTLLNK